MSHQNASRRSFLKTAIVSTIAAISLSASVAPAIAEEIAPFSPEAFQTAIETGKPVAVRFYETWCPQCTRQGKVVNDIVANDDAFDDFIILEAVFGEQRGFAADFGIRRRTSIALFKGDQYIDAIVGETRESRLREFLSAAL